MHTGAVFMHLSLQSYWHFDSKTCQDYTLAVILCTCHFQVLDTSIPKTARITFLQCIYWHVTSKSLTLRFQKLPGLYTEYVFIYTSTPNYWHFDSKTCQDYSLAIKLMYISLPHYWLFDSKNLPGLHTDCVFIDMPLLSYWHIGFKNCQDCTLAVYLCTCHFRVTDTSIPKPAKITHWLLFYAHATSKRLALHFQKLPGLHIGCWFMHMSLPSYWRFDSKTARIAHWLLIHWHVI